ncbi:hypothetical protein [Budvicia diplopodorum]|uniref:hypothetical protein n=1 Tax=Budvicia diplopodorum TaxID=1119056 RepID=UPI00135B0427|nr:hypothetical protein [Budvicia diplopodorum]
MNKYLYYVTATIVFLLTGFTHSSYAEDAENEIASIYNIQTGQNITVINGSEGGVFTYSAYDYRAAENSSAQNFTLSYIGLDNGTAALIFKNKSSMQCLASGVLEEVYGDVVVQRDCGGSETHWNMVYTSTGAVQLKNLRTQKCMYISSLSQSWSRLGLKACSSQGQSALKDTLWVVTARNANAMIN